MNAIRDLFSSTAASTATADKPEISAASIVARGAAAHAAALDALFDGDDGWKRNARHVLLVVDNAEHLKREAPITWNSAMVYSGGGRSHAVLPPQFGGWIDTRFESWLRERFPRLVSVLEPHDVRLVVWLEGKLHAFARVEGTWLDEAEIEAHAAELAEYKARQAEEQAKREDAQKRADEARARLQGEIAERTKAIEAAAEKTLAEEAQAEADRLDALAALSMDPSTILAIAHVLDLVDERGNLRPTPKHEELERLGAKVLASARALAVADAAVDTDPFRARDIGRSAVADVGDVESSRPGRRAMRVDLTRPRSDGSKYGHSVRLALAIFDGRLVAHVDFAGVVRVLDRDERAPLSWWT
jgi:hypothetical protein